MRIQINLTATEKEAVEDVTLALAALANVGKGKRVSLKETSENFNKEILKCNANGLLEYKPSDEGLELNLLVSERIFNFGIGITKRFGLLFYDTFKRFQNFFIDMQKDIDEEINVESTTEISMEIIGNKVSAVFIDYRDDRAVDLELIKAICDKYDDVFINTDIAHCSVANNLHLAENVEIAKETLRIKYSVYSVEETEDVK